MVSHFCRTLSDIDTYTRHAIFHKLKTPSCFKQKSPSLGPSGSQTSNHVSPALIHRKTPMIWWELQSFGTTGMTQGVLAPPRYSTQQLCLAWDAWRGSVRSAAERLGRPLGFFGSGSGLKTTGVLIWDFYWELVVTFVKEMIRCFVEADQFEFMPFWERECEWRTPFFDVLEPIPCSSRTNVE